MSRIPVAIVCGLIGFVIYVAGCVVLGDLVVPLAWPAQALYFALAGSVWVLPVRWLMLWAAGLR